MGGAQLRRLIRRMKGIAETDQTRDQSLAEKPIRHQARHPPPHGFATNEQGHAFRRRPRGGQILIHQAFGPRRRLFGAAGAAPGHIGKLEP